MNEFLKEVLGEDLLNQVNEKLKDSKIKLADLSTGDYVSKNKYSDELSAKDKQIDELNNTITTRDNDLKSLQDQLSNGADDREKALQEAQDQLSKLQKQYTDDKAKYEDELKEQKRTFAVKEKVNTLKFSSNSAKRAFTQDVLAKNLPFDDNGNLLGFDDFVSNYDDQMAFAKETKTDDVPPKVMTKTKGKTEDNDEKPRRIVI
jgi:archaellum component FlaC